MSRICGDKSTSLKRLNEKILHVTMKIFFKAQIPNMELVMILFLVDINTIL